MISIKEQMLRADQLAEQGQHDEALVSYNTILKEPRLRSDDYFMLCQKIGAIYTANNRFDEAKDIYKAAIARANQLKKYQRVSEFWHVSALNEINAKRPEEAIANFRHELDMTSSRNENYYSQLSTNYYEQGCLFMELGEYDEGRLYFELALTFSETDGIVISEARAHDGLGCYYLTSDEYDLALFHFTTALSRYNEAKDKAGAQRMRRQLKKMKEERDLT